MSIDVLDTRIDVALSMGEGSSRGRCDSAAWVGHQSAAVHLEITDFSFLSGQRQDACLISNGDPIALLRFDFDHRCTASVVDLSMKKAASVHHGRLVGGTGCVGFLCAPHSLCSAKGLAKTDHALLA